MTRWSAVAAAMVLVACADGLGTPSDGEAGGGGATGGGGDTFGSGGSGAGAACGQLVLQGYEPGPDAVLGTDDDVLAPGRTVWRATPQNVLERETYFAGPGPDGAWDTPDDVIEWDYRRIDQADGTLYFVMFEAPGDNGAWGDADDRIASASWARLDEAGRPIETRSYHGPGYDGVWMNADDPVHRRHTLAHGDGQSAPRLIDLEIVEPGPDGVWATADDPVAGATRRFDGWGTFTLAPGPDGVWATDDDPIYGRYEDRYDWEGFLQWLASYGAGPDAQFFTPDDVIEALAYSRCVDGARDTRLLYAPGADGAWGTADDLVQARLRITACDGMCGDLPTSPVEPK